MPKEVTDLFEGCPFLEQTGCAGMTETMRPRSSALYPGSLHAAARQVPHHRAAYWSIRRVERDEQVTISTSWASFCEVFEDGISCRPLERIPLRTSFLRMLNNERLSPPIEVFQLQP